MDKRYQVFISSTFEDLKEERQAALRAVLEMDHMPAGMELFPAADEDAWRLICGVIDASDYYVLIIGGRYGSLDETGLGYTEKEYAYAVAQRKPVVALLHRDPEAIPRGKTETSAKAWAKLKAFRAKVEQAHTCAYWRTPDDLRAQLIVGLTTAINRYPAKGWVRAGSLASEEASREIVELRHQVDEQHAEIERLSLAPPEGADRLAQGSDLLAIETRATLTNERLPWGAKGRQRYVSMKVDVSWDELFGAFSPSLVNAVREGQMKYRIARHMRDRIAPTIEAKHPEFKVTGLSIPDTLFQTIKVQFLALGLVDVRVDLRDGKDQQKKEVRVVELTERGKRHMIAVKAVPKSPSHTTLEPTVPLSARKRRKSRFHQ